MQVLINVIDKVEPFSSSEIDKALDLPLKDCCNLDLSSLLVGVLSIVSSSIFVSSLTFSFVFICLLVGSVIFLEDNITSDEIISIDGSARFNILFVLVVSLNLFLIIADNALTLLLFEISIVIYKIILPEYNSIFNILLGIPSSVAISFLIESFNSSVKSYKLPGIVIIILILLLSIYSS